MVENAFKSGYVTILGRPNVGKSTLLNRILGQKLSIVSEKPQTTRNRIVGVHHGENLQIIFLDTPGIHKGRGLMNQAMVEAALTSYEDASALLILVDGTEEPGPGDAFIASKMSEQKKPIILAVNKLDLIPPAQRPEKLEAYGQLGSFDAVLPISALDGSGVDTLLEKLTTLIPEGPPYFPSDMISDVPERFVAAEFVREKCFKVLEQELPYGVAVNIEQWQENTQANRVEIEATIFVAKESWKGMVIGKKGAVLKKVGTEARQDLEKMLGTHVVLKLWVKVKKDWTNNPAMLKALGISS